MSNERFKCPECEGEFDEPEPVRGKDEMYRTRIISYRCPWCEEEMSDLYTRRRAMKRCPHNAKVDGSEPGHRYVEVCCECGGKWDERGEFIGFKEAWASA